MGALCFSKAVLACRSPVREALDGRARHPDGGIGSDAEKGGALLAQAVAEDVAGVSAEPRVG
jgi:hypothetical protein